MQPSQDQIDKDKDNNPIMTPKTIKFYCSKEMLSQTPELNDKLYLYEKGFREIDNLNGFTNLVSLWLNSNKIERIENIENLKNLVCLYLNDNKIKKIEGLGQLKNLEILNLERNQISFIEGLENNLALKNLNIAENKLTNAQSISNLKALKNLVTLDISRNQLEQSEEIYQIISTLASVSCLNIKSTPFARGYKNYRKKIIAVLVHLKFLDDRPVQQSDHRLCEAFLQGGIEEERKQKNRMQIQESNRKAKISYEHDQMHDIKTKKIDSNKPIHLKTHQKINQHENIKQKEENEKLENENNAQAEESVKHTKIENIKQNLDMINSEIKQESQKNPRLQQWKKQYEPILEVLLERHKFDFEEVQPQFNMIIAEINKKLKKNITRFQRKDLQKIWTQSEVARRAEQKI